MDIEKIKTQTPGSNNVIHFNNAGASLMSKKTLDSQISYLSAEAEFGGYETADKYHGELESLYDQLAQLINATPEEIAYCESATVAWQRAFFSIDFKRGDEIITGDSEYASNYISFLNAEKKFGVKIVPVPSSSQGEIDLSELENSINHNTKLIAITHMPTNGGLVIPAVEIGQIAKKHDILYLLDACQSAGQYPIDVRQINCDFLSATGRKYLRGPRGTGFLFVKGERLKNLTPTNLDLHGAEWTELNSYISQETARKFETWESNLAAKYGFVNAIRELNQLGISNVWRRVGVLADYLREELEKLNTIVVYDLGAIKSGIVTFRLTSMSTEELKKILSTQNINTSIVKPSSTLLDSTNRNLKNMTRASVHYYNTMEEIDTFIKVLKSVV